MYVSDTMDMPDKSLLTYRSQFHSELPHIVKFSGGRTSGMLTLLLLEQGCLNAERGDVIIFNNTSAEHLETYNFVIEFKDYVERNYDIPVFLTQYQTYEGVRNGHYTRLHSYKLVNNRPWSSGNPNGYHWKGEAFEEMVSWKCMLPNKISRICTSLMKVGVEKQFLNDWFSDDLGLNMLGHTDGYSRLTDNDVWEGYLRNGGDTIPRDILLRKRKYARGRPLNRPQQYWVDYSCNGEWWERTHKIDEWITFIGFRADEHPRVARMRERNAKSTNEYAYAPLYDIGVTEMDVRSFWKRRAWGLPKTFDHKMSNCAYCFLKGASKIVSIRNDITNIKKDTPSDLNWWIRIEKQYGRYLDSNGKETGSGDKLLGFFHASRSWTYESLSKMPTIPLLPFDDNLPCDCTD